MKLFKLPKLHYFVMFAGFNWLWFTGTRRLAPIGVKARAEICFSAQTRALAKFIWQEGLLLDFLQKQTTGVFIKKFLTGASYVFNERLVFDKITKFYTDFLLWPAQQRFMFEPANVGALLTTILGALFIALLGGFFFLAAAFTVVL